MPKRIRGKLRQEYLDHPVASSLMTYKDFKSLNIRNTILKRYGYEAETNNTASQ
jgi:hypothetical protein